MVCAYINSVNRYLLKREQRTMHMSDTQNGWDGQSLTREQSNFIADALNSEIFALEMSLLVTERGKETEKLERRQARLKAAFDLVEFGHDENYKLFTEKGA
tara:strand:- start:1521 stop:1823 length:303 start_codon:yes stop_codon:yes gene_type:complete